MLAGKLVEAQSVLGAGSLRGIIVDTSGGAISGAKVTLTETSKDWIRTSETGSDGSFLFTSVIAGVYSIQVDLPGFKTEHIDNLRLEVGQQAAVTIRLEPAGAQTSITVRAPTPTELDAQSNTIGSLVDSALVQSIVISRELPCILLSRG